MKLISVEYEEYKTLSAARAAAGRGYDNPTLLIDAPTAPYDVSRYDISDLNVEFGHALAALGMAAAMIRARHGRSTLRVLDFGGALGGHYGVANTAFGGSVDFEWTVLEQELFVEHGRRLITTPALRFVADPAEAPAPDFAYFSGVLQYLPSLDFALRPEVLKDAPMIYIARTHLEEKEVPFLQTARYDKGDVLQPARIIAHDELNGLMDKLGYRLHTSWRNEQWCLGRGRATPSQFWIKRDA